MQYHQVTSQGPTQPLVTAATCGPGCVVEQRHRPRSHLDVVGEHTGLIRDVVLLCAVKGYWTALARGASTPGSAGIPVLCHGTATSTDADDARDRAIYEALERYCAGFWRVDDLQPAACTCDGDFDSEGPKVALQSLDGGAKVLVPAARVYLPFIHRGRSFDGDSVGLACGRSEGDALGRAVDELIERWLVEPWVRAHCKSGPNAGAGESLVTDHAKVISRVVLGASMRHIAVAMIGADRPPFCALGFGCHTIAAQALDKARAESRHVQAHMVMLAAAGRCPKAQANGGLETILQQAAFDRNMAARFKAAMDTAAPRLKAPLLHLAPRDVLWRNLTTPDVQSLGLEVVRAVLAPQRSSSQPSAIASYPSGKPILIGRS